MYCQNHELEAEADKQRYPGRECEIAAVCGDETRAWSGMARKSRSREDWARRKRTQRKEAARASWIWEARSSCE